MSKRSHGDTASPGEPACGRRSCMTEAAPDSLYCPQHAREIVLGLEECRVAGCDERVPFGSLWCEEHAELRRLGRLSVTGEAVPRHLWPADVPPAVEPVTSIRLVPPPEPRPRGGAHAVPALPTAEGRPFEVVPRAPSCRKCDQPVREGGARAGRYGNLCVEHYDEQRTLTSEACKRSTPGRRIGGSEPRREDTVPEPTPVAPAAEDPTPDAPPLDAPLPEIGAALRREGERARAQEVEVIGGIRMTGVPPQEELDAEPACTHEHQQVNGRGLVTCCACGLLLGHADPLGHPGPLGPSGPSNGSEGVIRSGGRHEPLAVIHEAVLTPTMDWTVHAAEETPAQRVLDAYARSIADALSAWGCELTAAESSYGADRLAEHAERLLACGPGVRAAVELLEAAGE